MLIDHKSKSAMTCSIDQLLCEKQVARQFGMSIRTLQKWRVTGDGPAFAKLGGAVRYAAADVAAFIEKSRRASTSDDGSANQGQR